jgi:hypothetical protein
MKLGMRATQLMAALLGLAAREGSMGFRAEITGPTPIGWTRAHQGAREMARRQRQAASKKGAQEVAEQAAEAL